ncbi:hypothetical protein AVEN_153585-1 [Araneus ventricosus]|uniref:Uncharacterized protein n=1 Tax=Araneus ventricosus TaxID=182803 RepID=A0A4Y2BQA2_ARAVE|nr:hypothetical protein AVEN_153585-1 [Araneus ventricosus]
MQYPKCSIYNPLLSSNTLGPLLTGTRSPNSLATKTSRRHSTGIKDKVYSREIRDVEDLRASITATNATVTMGMLQQIWLELDYRLDILRATKYCYLILHFSSAF